MFRMRCQTVSRLIMPCLLIFADAPAAAQMICAANATPTNDVPNPAVRMAPGQRRSVMAANAPVA
jgi:hypothetical protein